MKKTIILTENDLHEIVKEAIKEMLSEVKYNGVSYHGTNPYDWVDIANKRGEKADAYDDASIKAKHMGDTKAAEEYDNKSDMEYAKRMRDKRNARNLGWQGKDDTRLKKAQEYFNMSQSAQNPQERQKYIQMANNILGDVTGRANQALDGLKR